MNWQKFYASEAVVYGFKETFNNFRLALFSMLILLGEILVSIIVVMMPVITFAIWQMPELRTMLRSSLFSQQTESMVVIFQNGTASSVTMPVVIVGVIAAVVLLVLWSMFAAGYIRMLLKFHNNGTVNLNEMFMGWHKGPRILLAGIIFSVAVLVGFLLFVIPGIYILVHGILFPFFIVDKNVGAFEALKRSFAVVHGYGWQILAIIFIGFVFTINPVASFLTSFAKLLMNVHAYRRLTA